MQEPTFDLINEQSKNSWMEQQEPSYLGAKMPRKINKVRTLLPRPRKQRQQQPTKMTKCKIARVATIEVG
jgi:hypothetical protein